MIRPLDVVNCHGRIDHAGTGQQRTGMDVIGCRSRWKMPGTQGVIESGVSYMLSKS